MESPASSTVHAALSRGTQEVSPSSSLNYTKPVREKLPLGHLLSNLAQNGQSVHELLGMKEQKEK